MRKLFVLLPLVFLAACSSSPLPTGPSSAASGSTFSVADLPPSNGNAAYSCPTDAPTGFAVQFQNATFRNGAVVYPLIVEWRPTGVNVTRYVLEVKRRERNQGPAVRLPDVTLDGRTSHTLYYGSGIYHFRVRAGCPDAAWSVEIVRSAGESAGFPPDMTPPPPEPEPEPEEPKDEEIS